MNSDRTTDKHAWINNARRAERLIRRSICNTNIIKKDRAHLAGEAGLWGDCRRMGKEFVIEDWPW
jgi:hypothetical protein